MLPLKEKVELPDHLKPGNFDVNKSGKQTMKKTETAIHTSIATGAPQCKSDLHMPHDPFEKKKKLKISHEEKCHQVVTC